MTSTRHIIQITALLAVCAIAVTSGVVYVLSARENNLVMLDLRDKVIAADESGLGVEESLRRLQQHVTSHMNANPPKLGDEPAIQLKASFDRAKKAETERVSAERKRIADEATAYCEAELRSQLLSARADCVARYISDRPVIEKQIIADLYRYDFVSPRWSPDKAGFALLAAISFSMLFIAAVIFWLGSLGSYKQ